MPISSPHQARWLPHKRPALTTVSARSCAWCTHRAAKVRSRYFDTLGPGSTVAKPFQNAQEGWLWADPDPCDSTHEREHTRCFPRSTLAPSHSRLKSRQARFQSEEALIFGIVYRTPELRIGRPVHVLRLVRKRISEGVGTTQTHTNPLGLQSEAAGGGLTLGLISKAATASA